MDRVGSRATEIMASESDGCKHLPLNSLWETGFWAAGIIWVMMNIGGTSTWPAGCRHADPFAEDLE